MSIGTMEVIWMNRKNTWLLPSVNLTNCETTMSSSEPMQSVCFICELLVCSCVSLLFLFCSPFVVFFGSPHYFQVCLVFNLPQCSISLWVSCLCCLSLDVSSSVVFSSSSLSSALFIFVVVITNNLRIYATCITQPLWRSVDWFIRLLF